MDALCHGWLRTMCCRNEQPRHQHFLLRRNYLNVVILQINRLSMLGKEAKQPRDNFPRLLEVAIKKGYLLTERGRMGSFPIPITARFMVM